jgi:PHD/YefM family antitoxin component YafN of YafNO toxin-antitoxin module
MKSTVSITKAQATLPEIVRAERLVGISKHNEVQGFYVPRERFEAIMETLEILSDPEAMKALRAAKAGKGKYVTLAQAAKEWGL